MTRKEYKQSLSIFKGLHKACQQPDSYSVTEVAQKLDFDYSQIQALAKEHEHFAHMLSMCLLSCHVNTEEASLYGKLDWEKTVRYSLEGLEDGDPEKAFYAEELKKIEDEKLRNQQGEFVMIQDVKSELAEVTLANDNSIESYHEQTKLLEQERIKEWRAKEASASTRCRFDESSDKTLDTGNRKTVTMVYANNVPKDMESSIALSSFTAATGFPSSYAQKMLQQVANACGIKEGEEITAPNAIFQTLLSMKPNDEYEGMLISRLLVLHQQSMEHMIRANQNMGNQGLRESYINSATKLMRLHNETLEALNKHRRKGEQKVTVTHNHVNVNDGGKAIVSSHINQQPGGGDHDKK